jgi:N6-adenosine-specific RNA methylase IME4
VTKSGDPIVPFNIENGKQPYEVIIIGRRISSTHPHPNIDEEHDDLKRTKVILSTPSSIHSHKPPLVDILDQYLPGGSGSRKLEVFARYLVPGVTSFGNEVIKLQHSSLFVDTGE